MHKRTFGAMRDCLCAMPMVAAEISGLGWAIPSRHGASRKILALGQISPEPESEHWADLENKGSGA